MKSVQRTDVSIPANMNKAHLENIVGVVTLVLSDYSLSATVRGKVPSMKDIASVLAQKDGAGEYAEAWGKQ